MQLTQDPVTLYGPNGQRKSIPAVDAPGWLAAGWSLEESRGGREALEEELIDINSSATPAPPAPLPSAEAPPKRKKLVAVENDPNSLPES